MTKLLPLIALGAFYGLYLGHRTGLIVAAVTGALMQLYIYALEREKSKR